MLLTSGERAHVMASRHGPDTLAHVERVAAKFPPDSTRYIVALLHDSLEDGIVTEDELNAKFSHHTVDAIYTISRRKESTYENYISIVATNLIATDVKKEDILDNLLGRSGPPSWSLIKRYVKAYHVLKGVEI